MIWAITGLLLSLTSFLVSIIALTTLPWTSFTHDSETFTHNLFSLQSSSRSYPRADYFCLQSSACPSIDKTLCSLSENLVLGRKVLLPFECIFLLFEFLIIERLLLRLFQKPFGPSWFVLLLAWATPFLKTCGTVTFLVISNVSVDSSNKQDNQVYAETAVFLMFLEIFISFVRTIVVFWKKIHVPVKVFSNEPDWNSSRLVNPALMLVLSFLAMILAQIYPVASFQEFDNVTISFDKVLKSDEIFKGINFQCASGLECKEEQPTCDLFEGLEDASKYSRTIQYFSVLSGVIWTENLLMLLANYKFSVPLVVFSAPFVYFFSQMAEFITFMVTSHTRFSGNCKVSSFHDDWRLCSELGAVFFIVSLIFCFLSLLFFEFSLVIKSNQMESLRESQVRPGTSCEELKKEKTLDVTDLDNSAFQTVAIISSPIQTIGLEESSRHMSKIIPIHSERFEFT
jgi:hypothetical protein